MTKLTTTAGNDDRPLGPGARHLIALDIDGTLVDHHGAMSPRVRELGSTVARGPHAAVLATGRSLGATLPIAERLGLRDGFAVCSNGGITVRLDAQADGGFRIVHRDTFDPAGAIASVHDAVPGVRIAVETENCDFLVTPGFHDDSFGVRGREASLDEMARTRAVRLVVSHADIDADEFHEAVVDAGLSGVSYAIGFSAWLDISGDGVSKASALERVRAELGIESRHTLAVGDGFNDLEMLRWAGTGYAMGQAADAVKAAADRVTGTVYEDGAADVLENLAEDRAAA